MSRPTLSGCCASAAVPTSSAPARPQNIHCTLRIPSSPRVVFLPSQERILRRFRPTCLAAGGLAKDGRPGRAMKKPSKTRKSVAPASPLAGVRIVDMTTVLMGPYATQILADYGADVIKVEPPEGDIMRHGGPMRNPRMGPMFLQANRNKRSVVVDIKKAGGRDVLLRLCKSADVFICNVRPAA